jgi:hypothetical protein
MVNIVSEDYHIVKALSGYETLIKVRRDKIVGVNLVIS